MKRLSPFTIARLERHEGVDEVVELLLIWLGKASIRMTIISRDTYRDTALVAKAKERQWSRKQSRVAVTTDTSCGCGFDY